MDVYDSCPICGRELVPGTFDDHHLIPKTFKGREIITIHRMCHTKLHATFSENEMYQYYHTVERIVSHPDIISFVKWIRKKPPEFYSKNKDTKDRKRKRKR